MKALDETGSAAEASGQRVEDLIGKLTLAEKVALLSGADRWQTTAIERLGIPSLVMTDGPHGVRSHSSRDGTPEDGRVVSPATSFPTGVSIAASWNVELIQRVGEALGDEARAMGCDILLGPCVNIVRTPLGGRNFETYSEDPYLAGRIGVAFVEGVQSRGVGACVKHFACNNQEFERFRGNSVVDERTLREIYLPAFEVVVNEAKPWAVMTSYNRINGVYASQHHYLLKEILKGEWAFDGIVVSDWGGNHTTVESMEAGLDIEMPGPARWYGPLLIEAVQNWQIPEAAVDDSVRRLLRTIARSGRLYGEETLPSGSLNTPEHEHLARELAEESIVLLKNDDDILPMEANEVKTIAVIGPNAAEARLGGGGSSYLRPPYRVSPLEALRARASDSIEIRYADGEDIAEATRLAEQSDVAIVFGGMPQGFETEGRDRPDMVLPGSQDELISAVAQSNRTTIVVLNCGAPVSMPWLDEVPAVLEAFYAGQEGGSAIARILFGEVNPSGKLPVTFPRRLEDNPTFVNYPGTREVLYGERIYVGYRYYDKVDIEPLFPFGHGLSYTTFEYGDIQSPQEIELGDPVTISTRVSNTGPRAGWEAVQLYVHDKQASLDRPSKELKGFAKVSLEPGQSTTVTFVLDQRSLSFYDPYRASWLAEPGDFQILIGSSSRDIRSRATLRLVQ